MPAPSPSVLLSKTKANYGQKLGPEAEEYLDALFKAVTDGWKSWQSSMMFGGFTVSGAGVGAFSGSGLGGKLTASPFSMPSFSFKQNSPQQVKFTQALATTLVQKFNAFPPTYTISTMMFTGTSGATTNSPGPVQAQNTSSPMSAGSGQNPSGIADAWKAALTPPDFDLSNPQCKSGDLVVAIGKAIEGEFKNWLLATQLMGNKLSTTGAAGGTVTNIPTAVDGKLQ